MNTINQFSKSETNRKTISGNPNPGDLSNTFEPLKEKPKHEMQCQKKYTLKYEHSPNDDAWFRDYYY